MTFQEKIANLKHVMEKNLPAHYTETIHEATAELIDSGIREKVLKKGSQCPDFSLENEEGEYLNIKEMYLKGPVILIFYRGIWCPYCNMELAYLNEHVSEIEQLGASIIGVSPQIKDYNAKIIERSQLKFKLYSDPHNSIASQFGLTYSLSRNLKSLYIEALNIDLEHYNNDSSWTLPMPSQVLIDSKGIIRHIAFSEDYTQRADFNHLLETLKEL
ncbi:peroxiredoxin [Flavobacteriaceae bacterium UJ101]|nr:peroxiredoxin [Flavobacteriaceae bacterium UJ101]